MPVPPAISRSPLGRLLGLTPPTIKGALDEPGPRQPYARTLAVRGWTVSTDGAQLEVAIEADGRTVWTGAPTAPRADVEPLFPGVPTAATCGFAVQLDAEALPDLAEATLVVRARRPGTRETHEIGRAVITRHAHLEQGFTRTAYGQVWDEISQTEAAARVAVSGTADDDEWARSGEATAGDVRALAAVTADRRRPRDRVRRRTGRPLPGARPAATGPAATSRRTCCTSRRRPWPTCRTSPRCR